MHLLTISFYEFGQFLRILLWIFLPLFVIVLLVTTYIHHRRRLRESVIFLETEGLVLAMEAGNSELPQEGPSADASPVFEVIDMEQADGDNLYKGMLWMKQKFEEYREQADQRIGALKEQLDRQTAAASQLREELALAREKIAELTGKLEGNMSLLMNIHRELDRSLNTEKTAAAETPGAPSPDAKG
jgi:hypothetical protein